jgi:hypothetical protein
MIVLLTLVLRACFPIWLLIEGEDALPVVLHADHSLFNDRILHWLSPGCNCQNCLFRVTLQWQVLISCQRHLTQKNHQRGKERRTPSSRPQPVLASFFQPLRLPREHEASEQAARASRPT